MMQQLQLALLDMALVEAAASPGPFVKWPGGKGGVLAQLCRHLPTGPVRRYVEPFLGGGALFWHLAHASRVEQFVLNDANPDLMNAYRAVQQAVEPLIERLAGLQDRFWPLAEPERKAMYYEVRDAYNTTPRVAGIDVERASWLMFLNRTCFNGLYRVNQAGQFNVAFGRYDRPAICNAPLLRACSAALGRATLLCGDFEQVLPHLQEGTLVYLDPPYRPTSSTANFTRYTASSFDELDQARLAKFARRGKRKKAWVMASNSWGEWAGLYPAFQQHAITAERSISVKVETRGAVQEALLTSY